MILGASKLSHLEQNLLAVEQGPLSQSLQAAFEEAWQLAQGEAPAYFTLYQGKGK